MSLMDRWRRNYQVAHAGDVCGRCGKTRGEHFGKIKRGVRVHDWCYEFRKDLSEAMRWAVFTPDGCGEVPPNHDHSETTSDQ